MLKALKTMFGKGDSSQASAPQAPAAVDSTAGQSNAPAPAARSSEPDTSQPAPSEKPRSPRTKSDKPRRERPAKPVDTWKLEDFAVEPAEGKTRFHDFNLAPELMHAIHDLGFPYCTPIQAQVLGHTLRGKDAIGRAQTGTGKTAAFLPCTITADC